MKKNKQLTVTAKAKPKEEPCLNAPATPTVIIDGIIFSVFYKLFKNKELFLMGNESILPTELKLLSRDNFIDLKYLTGKF